MEYSVYLVWQEGRTRNDGVLYRCDRFHSVYMHFGFS